MRTAIALSITALLHVFMAVLPATTAEAQGAQPAMEREMQVVTRVLPPMVVQRGDELSGFSIELWNEIARRLNLKFKYHTAPNVAEQLAQVRSGKADLAVAAISITSAREEEFDFSQPMMNAGLQIMVRNTGEGSQSPLTDVLTLLFSWTSLAWLGVALLLIIIPAHIVWYAERNEPNGMIPHKSYFPGIFEALYWAAGTLATQSDRAPRNWIGRVVGVLWMFAGIVFVALYTAQLAAQLTVQQIGGNINGPNDLAGKLVAVTSGSTAAAAVREYNGKTVEVSDIQEAYRSLDRRAVEAIVFDSPVLLYYAANEGKGRVATVGAPFRKEDYGILFPRDSELRTKVNVTLLKIREDGTYQRLYEKWFGSR